MVTVRAVRRLGRDTGAGRGIFAKDFAFHVDSAANSCGIHMIMLRAAVAPGQSGRNGQAGAWRGANRRTT